MSKHKFLFVTDINSDCRVAIPIKYIIRFWENKENSSTFIEYYYNKRGEIARLHAKELFEIIYRRLDEE